VTRYTGLCYPVHEPLYIPTVLQYTPLHSLFFRSTQSSSSQFLASSLSIPHILNMSATGLTESTLQGTAIGLMVVTTAIVGARIVLRSDKKKCIQWDELWLLVGYLLFMAVTSVYINKTSLLFRLLAVQEGRIELYPTIVDDGLNAQKTFFFTSPGLWLTLWSIKFSLLAFYKKLMVNVELYRTLWWVVLGYCVVVRITPPYYTRSKGLNCDLDAYTLPNLAYHCLRSYTGILVRCWWMWH
jgi:hypothetical protein